MLEKILGMVLILWGAYGMFVCWRWHRIARMTEELFDECKKLEELIGESEDGA